VFSVTTGQKEGTWETARNPITPSIVRNKPKHSTIGCGSAGKETNLGDSEHSRPTSNKEKVQSKVVHLATDLVEKEGCHE